MPATDAGASGVTASNTCTVFDPRLVDEAAQWLVRMHSGNFTEADAHRCEAWRNQSPEHQRIWQSAEQLQQKFGAVPPEVGMSVLNRRRVRERRRTLLKVLVPLSAVPLTLWASHRTASWRGWGAQYSTGVGERRDIRLADGSLLSINTSSAVDVEFDAAQRVIRQRSGEILIQTALDPGQNRPFIVQTAHGSLRALGTRFVVRQEEDTTRLTVLEGAVLVTPVRSAQSARVVHAGRRTTFTGSTIGPDTMAEAGAGQWVRSVLYAEEMRLADFAAELERYRPGIVRCDPRVANVRVSGAFQLGNTDRILSVLEQTLPVRVDFRTRYWVSIAAR